MVNDNVRFGLALALLAAFALPGCGQGGRSAGAATAELFGAASTSDALDQIQAGFEQTEGVRVRTNYAASSTLAHQIENGAGADVFLSANVQWVDHLESKGLVARRRDLLGNRLVVVVPSDSQARIAGLKDLLDRRIERLALADPDAVPAGIYAKQALVKTGLWEGVRKKVVAGADVRRALSFVETGNAQAGIVYATDAALSDSVKVALEIDPSLTGPVRYPLVLLRGAAHRPAAVSLFNYLGGPEAAAVFRKYGFTVLEAPAAQGE
jgi:molybdate transport system substrate-binding protein